MDKTIPTCSGNFVFANEAKEEVVDKGLSRKILGYEASLMLVKARFEEGAEGYVHQHPHAQLAYVESGQFDFTIGDETRRLGPGDCAYIPPNVDHGAICREAGVLLDIFSPLREDFLKD